MTTKELLMVLVPGHCDDSGNEIADKQAKLGSAALQPYPTHNAKMRRRLIARDYWPRTIQHQRLKEIYIPPFEHWAANMSKTSYVIAAVTIRLFNACSTWPVIPIPKLSAMRGRGWVIRTSRAAVFHPNVGTAQLSAMKGRGWVIRPSQAAVFRPHVVTAQLSAMRGRGWVIRPTQAAVFRPHVGTAQLYAMMGRGWVIRPSQAAVFRPHVGTPNYQLWVEDAQSPGHLRLRCSAHML